MHFRENNTNLAVQQYLTIKLIYGNIVISRQNSRRNSRLELFCKQVVLGSFVKSLGKQLWGNLFLIKL